MLAELSADSAEQEQYWKYHQAGAAPLLADALDNIVFTLGNALALDPVAMAPNVSNPA